MIVIILEMSLKNYLSKEAYSLHTTTSTTDAVETSMNLIYKKQTTAYYGISLHN